MSAWANINGAAVAAGSLTMPTYGTWSADIELPLSGAIASPCTLVIGNLSLFGSVVRSADFAGSQTARIVGGYAGWAKSIVARSYRSAGGVLLSHVLGDAAIEVGEKLKIGTDRQLGAAYVREAGPAARLLRILAGALWWMDLAGVTQLGARSNAVIKSDFQVISYAGGLGKLQIATESPADWTPGRTFTAPTVPIAKTIRSVSHRFDSAGTHRLEVLAS